jgi:geranylgeranyl pyrophosphate synthase
MEGALAEAAAPAEAFLARVAAACEPVLAGILDDPEVPGDLAAAMRHAVLGGGKRLRPALCLAAAEACGAADAVPRLVPAACALELVHTYSLVHDDLPAMDDAPLRRGRPTCHRVFGEALAILAGDALQALAFEVLVRPMPGVAPGDQARAVAELARAVGPRGMCGGQALDLAAERQPPDDAGLWRLERLKTGALITAAVVVGGILAQAPAERLRALDAYGAAFGEAFQIADDVLDVVGAEADLGKATGGDARRGKPTVAARHGVARARALAEAAAVRAWEALEGWDHRADPLRWLAAFAACRRR